MGGLKKISSPIICAVIIILSAAAVFRGGMSFSEKIYSQHHKELVGRFGAAVSMLSEEEAGRAAFAFTGDITENNIQTGETYLKKYGCAEYIPAYNEKKQCVYISFCAAAAVVLSAAAVLAVTAAAGKARDKEMLRQIALAEQICSEKEYHENHELEGALRRMSNAFSRISEYAVVLRDRTEKEREYIKTVISDISHQMKTPAAALRMNMEIIMSDPDMPPKVMNDFLGRSLEQTDRLEWLITGLLKSARLDSGCTEMVYEEHSLFDAAEEAARQYSSKAEEKNITLLNTVPTAAVLNMDFRWLCEAFGNIICNSVEHTPHGGRVEISGYETPLTAVVTITDNGCGIPPEALSRIFDRFYSSKSGKGSDKNVGIGLSVSKSIIEKHNGSICVSSDERGSVFKMTFLRLKL